MQKIWLFRKFVVTLQYEKAKRLITIFWMSRVVGRFFYCCDAILDFLGSQAKVVGIIEITP